MVLVDADRISRYRRQTSASMWRSLFLGTLDRVIEVVGLDHPRRAMLCRLRESSGQYGIRWKETSFMTRLPRERADMAREGRLLDMREMPALIHHDETRVRQPIPATAPRWPTA